ncbi:palindromic element RPE1 domain-containing protein [Rickettsia sp. Oklahoma-10]|uniref:Palindromic element RPE1 domain-containing protein n=1 Tax=Rickettsia oklahomensis TaxID=3141789 RepID=A0AAU7BY71_9RICK
MILSVKIAHCTALEPVSFSVIAYSLINCCLRSVVIDIDNFSLIYYTSCIQLIKRNLNTKRRTTEYTIVSEDASIGLTCKLPLETS